MTTSLVFVFHANDYHELVQPTVPKPDTGADTSQIQNEQFKRAEPIDEDLGPPDKFIIMVPYSSFIDPKVEEKLRFLTSKGFRVFRRQGAALDNVCSAMSSDALKNGWKELLWVDASVDFDIGGIGLARRSGKSIVGALYPTADGTSWATHFLDGTSELKLGAHGGLLEVRHTGMGFLYVKAEVFLTIKTQLALPDCNEGFEDALVPWFKSFVAEKGGAPIYLVYHRAFCERARQAGLQVYVDTRIRASTVGPRPYLWEDVLAGGDRSKKKQLTVDITSIHEEFV